MMTCCRVDDICRSCVLCFFVNDTATTEIYTLSLHDALPIFEPGRVTVNSLHWARTAAGMVPVSHSEFARDASFGYLNSDLRAWVEEKTAGRIGRDQVAAITLTDIRQGGPDRVAEILTGLSGGQPVVVDAADDADLRVVVLALLRAEAAGKNFVYRTGP